MFWSEARARWSPKNTLGIDKSIALLCIAILCFVQYQVAVQPIHHRTANTNERGTNEQGANKRANERTNERASERTNQRTNERTRNKERTSNQERGRRKLNFSMESNEWNRKNRYPRECNVLWMTSIQWMWIQRGNN